MVICNNVKSLDAGAFRVCRKGEAPPAVRGLGSPEGIGDRLRTAAFAELQAREAFRWAAKTFSDAPEPLRRAWEGFAEEEDRHLAWLLARMTALGIDPAARAVSTRLWDALLESKTGLDFERLIALAEERGRQAGETIGRKLAQCDPDTAAVFRRIAEEEKAHVALALELKVFPIAS